MKRILRTGLVIAALLAPMACIDRSEVRDDEAAQAAATEPAPEEIPAKSTAEKPGAALGRDLEEVSALERITALTEPARGDSSELAELWELLVVEQIAGQPQLPDQNCTALETVSDTQVRDAWTQWMDDELLPWVDSGDELREDLRPTIAAPRQEATDELVVVLTLLANVDVYVQTYRALGLRANSGDCYSGHLAPYARMQMGVELAETCISLATESAEPLGAAQEVCRQVRQQYESAMEDQLGSDQFDHPHYDDPICDPLPRKNGPR